MLCFSISNVFQLFAFVCYIYVTFVFLFYYTSSIILFYLLQIVLPLFFHHLRSSSDISLTVTILLLSVIAIFSATTNGSIKSINTLAGEDAKLAPRIHYCFKKALACSCKYDYIFHSSCCSFCFYYRIYKIF